MGFARRRAGLIAETTTTTTTTTTTADAAGVFVVNGHDVPRSTQPDV